MGRSLVFTGMVIAILAQTTNLIVRKTAFSEEMNKFVYVVYSDALVASIALPCSLIFDRSQRPPLTFSIIFRIFSLSLIGVHIDISGCVGIAYSSPLLVTAMLNLIPALTFVLAIIFRMEKLDWRSRGSLAKLLGTIVSITGAFVITFYKGMPLFNTSSSMTVSQAQQILSPHSNWILGGFFLAAQAILISAWYISETLVVRRFPAIFTIMFFENLFSTALSGLYGFFLVENSEAWRLRLDVGLVSILYAAIIAGVLEMSVILWCLSKAGPLYVSMFKPLAIVFAVVLDFIFLGESLGLGSLIGAIVIVIGLYSVIWGKAEEEYAPDGTKLNQGNPISSDENAPLLQNKIEEININTSIV